MFQIDAIPYGVDGDVNIINMLLVISKSLRINIEWLAVKLERFPRSHLRLFKRTVLENIRFKKFIKGIVHVNRDYVLLKLACF